MYLATSSCPFFIKILYTVVLSLLTASRKVFISSGLREFLKAYAWSRMGFGASSDIEIIFSKHLSVISSTDSPLSFVVTTLTMGSFGSSMLALNITFPSLVRHPCSYHASSAHLPMLPTGTMRQRTLLHTFEEHRHPPS